MFLSSSYFIGFIFAILIFYAILKEMKESGCYCYLSTGLRCIDENSVYVKNTKASKEDDSNELYKKLESILSYHEKGTIWRRCMIIASIITLFIYIIYNTNKTINNNINQYAIFIFIIFAIIHCYHTYIFFHNFKINS